MSSTNKTAELHLSQFIGTDIPSILTDYNGDMQKIDAGVLEVKQATAGAVSDLSSVTARVTNAEQNISGLNSTVQGIATRVVTAESDIDEVDSRVATVQENVDNIASLIKGLTIYLYTGTYSEARATQNLNTIYQALQHFGVDTDNIPNNTYYSMPFVDGQSTSLYGNEINGVKGIIRYYKASNTLEYIMFESDYVRTQDEGATGGTTVDMNIGHTVDKLTINNGSFTNYSAEFIHRYNSTTSSFEALSQSHGTTFIVGYSQSASTATVITGCYKR